ncbi:MAG TPA: BrnA antitoxin family protein [Longimicrobium sp.]
MPPYRLDELPEGRTDWARLDREAREAGGPGNDDDENPLWTAQAFAEADLITPGGLKRTPVYIRMYQAVLDYYRSFGKGYQTRINNDLLDLVRKRQRQASRIHPVRQRRVRVARGTQSWEGRATTPRAG